MSSEIHPYRESSPSMQIVARRVDLRQSFAQARAVPNDGAQRLASRLLIASSLAGLVLTLVGHL
ncbi:MAG TPA: hypothetical protein VH082_09370 [Rudaea sp.]|jgi:hypothetical protein|nr:hypothetical protein [Rudaea sp.]